MAPPDLRASSIQRADAIIRATKQHLIPDGLSPEDRSDTAMFLDIDLSILATSEHIFEAYEGHIRMEYAFVPEPIYVQARSGILKGFLNRERLYFSDFFRDLWEAQARSNLKRSIEKLDAKDSDNG